MKQVAKELELAHVWSWGWAQRDERSNDPDKTYAACVWLWARDASLCDAPTILGRELDADTKTGQLDLPSGTRCMYGSTPLRAASVAALAKVTHDRELALTALVARAIERERTRVSPSDALALERRVVGRGSAGARSRIARRWSTPGRASPSRAGSSATSSAGRRSSSGSPRAHLLCRCCALPSDVCSGARPRGDGLAGSELAPRRAWCRARHLGARGSCSACRRDRRSTIRTAEGTFMVEAHDDDDRPRCAAGGPARGAIDA